MDVVLQSVFDNSSTIMKGIMGGVGASAREFPYQVGITYQDRFYCGGSILSSIFILTGQVFYKLCFIGPIQ